MLKLIKHSRPGWTREYGSIDELTKAVYNHTCSLCKASYGIDLEGMLMSECGNEYSAVGHTLDEPLTTYEQIDHDYWASL